MINVEDYGHFTGIQHETVIHHNGPITMAETRNINSCTPKPIRFWREGEIISESHCIISSTTKEVVTIRKSNYKMKDFLLC